MFNKSELELIKFGVRAAIVRIDKQLLTTKSERLKEVRNLRIVDLLSLEQKVNKFIDSTAEGV